MGDENVVLLWFCVVFAGEGFGGSETGLWDTVWNCTGGSWRRTGVKNTIQNGVDGLWAGNRHSQSPEIIKIMKEKSPCERWVGIILGKVASGHVLPFPRDRFFKSHVFNACVPKNSWGTPIGWDL